jgi:hypothetical protein
MPDASANINATAFWPVDCDPICWTCDIRATVRDAENQADRETVAPATTRACETRLDRAAFESKTRGGLHFDGRKS